jgi:HNH endonuclease
MTAQLELPLGGRFWSKVQRSESGCWEWTAAKTVGYGRFADKGRTLLAHRVAYELLIGPIPEGLQIDHLCRNPSCVNPAHLEPVTSRENLLRGVGEPARNAAKTHCPQGHEYSPENTYAYRGMRMCVECRRIVRAGRLKSATAVAFMSDLSDPRHGTLTGYASYGCRCGECKQRAVEYRQRRKQAA